MAARSSFARCMTPLSSSAFLRPSSSLFSCCSFLVVWNARVTSSHARQGGIGLVLEKARARPFVGLPRRRSRTQVAQLDVLLLKIFGAPACSDRGAARATRPLHRLPRSAGAPAFKRRSRSTRCSTLQGRVSNIVTGSRPLQAAGGQSTRHASLETGAVNSLQLPPSSAAAPAWTASLPRAPGAPAPPAAT